MERGRKQGLAEAQVEVARWKFGEATAARLAELLGDIDDEERVLRIGRSLIECETRDELIAEVAQD